MRGKEKGLWLALVLALGLVAMPLGARAQQSNAVPAGLFNAGAQPYAPESVKILGNVIQSGGHVYYMGERSGLSGWLVVKDGQLQLLYVSADRHSVIVGGLFTDAGDSVSSPQLTRLSKTNPAVTTLMKPSAMQQRDVMLAGAVVGGTASVPANFDATKTIGNVLPAVSLAPGERLVMDLRAAAGVTLGEASVPELYMLVDGACSQCADIWKDLAEPVKTGKLQVHLIPTTIGNEAVAQTKQMAMLLQAKQPLESWEKFLSGDKKVLEGEPDALHVKAIGANRAMMDRWHIQIVPYLVYRSMQDHEVKIIQGKPNRMASVLVGLLGK